MKSQDHIKKLLLLPMRMVLMVPLAMALVLAVSGVASASLITGVVRANGQSGNRDPIGAYDGNTAPLATQAGGLMDGNLVFSDRMYPWANTPVKLIGAEYIRTFNTDKNRLETDVTYTVTISRPCTVAITVDDRIPSQQDAVDAVVVAFAAPGTFQDTGLTVYIRESATIDRPMSVFAAELPAGTYVFGPQPSTHNFYTVAAIPATITGCKFYDADADGEWDDGEPPIEGWMVHLTGTDILSVAVDEYAFTDTEGKFIFEELLPGTYMVEEVFPPAPPTWLGTTDTSFTHNLERGEDYAGPDFGNVCLQTGHGGLSLGFWSNKNGQGLITADDIAALNALNLYNPGWTYPPFGTAAQIRKYLLSATAVDMRWMLSGQLIATKLDVLHGFLSGSTIVHVGLSTYVPSGFIPIAEIMDNANDALLLDPQHDPDCRAEQEYWKNLLDGLNNNSLPFVCPAPCLPIEYPP